MCATSWCSVTELFIQLTQWELGTRHAHRALSSLTLSFTIITSTMATQIFWYCWTYLILFVTSFFPFYLWHPRQLPGPVHDMRTRSRAHPLGCPDLSAKDRQSTQNSNNSFVEQAALQCVPFLFLCPEDFGGHSQHGPVSPWSLVEFQCLSGFNDTWRGAAFVWRFADMEQRHSTGMLTNIQGLRRSVYPGWPLLRKVNDNLQHEGPLPHLCPCSFVHKDPINGTRGSFLSASSFSLSFSFWSRLFRDAWCSGHDTLRDGEKGLKPLKIVHEKNWRANLLVLEFHHPPNFP